jgi:ABC-type nitrate/sulfonate/bicarbonate transport system substrate-binding protein
MSSFEIRFAKVESDQAELFSTLQRLTTTLRRLSSRAGMEDLREKRASAPPPQGTPKAQLREFYKLNGLTPQQIAQRQMFTDRAEGLE